MAFQSSAELEPLYNLMKVRSMHRVVTLALLVGGVSFLMHAEREVNEGYPSKIFFQKTGWGQDARFVLVEMPDLRLLFCDRPLLKDRISRSVCVVDDVRRTLGEGAPAKAKEVQIEGFISVGELLKKIGMEGWRSGQPQMRVVKRDSIIQSALPSDTDVRKTDAGAFLSHRLQPGDFLIITPKS